MRPVPKSRNLVALLVFAAVAASYGFFAFRDGRTSEPQAYLAAAALKQHDPALFAHDPVFGPSGLWRFYPPALVKAMDLLLAPAGYQDPLLPFRAMAGVLTMIYLCGMYSLLYRQCRSWSVAAFTAVLSTTVVFALGRSHWGVGSLASATPWGFCVALTPPAALAFLKHEAKLSRLVLVFGGVGLMGNINPALAMNLSLVLLIVYLGRRRFAARAWPAAGACAGAAFIGASPHLVYFLMLRASLSAGEGAGTASYSAFRLADLAVMYPELLKSIWGWVVVVAVVLVIPAVVVLSHVERFRVRDVSCWAWFIAASLGVALVLHGASQLIGLLAGTAPPVIDFVHASALVMLPLYVLFAQALTNVFRLVRSYRGLIRLACAAIMAGWMIPSDNLAVARNFILDAATARMAEPDQPRIVTRRRRTEARRAEMAAIARFAANDTSADTVFITDSLDFRMLSRRSAVGCPYDARFAFYLAPGELEEWVNPARDDPSILEEPAPPATMPAATASLSAATAPSGHPISRPATDPQETIFRFSPYGAAQGLLHPPGASSRASGAVLRKYILALADRPEFAGASRWFVILDVGEAPDRPGPLAEIMGQWGRHYRLYELVPRPKGTNTPKAAASAPTIGKQGSAP